MVSDQEIQRRVLADFYDDAGGGFLYQHYGWRQSINDYADMWDDVEANDVEFAITTAEEDGLLRIDGSTAQIAADGLKELHDSGHDTNLSEDTQVAILEALLAYKRENPNGLGMGRDDLVDETGIDRTTIDENVWYLDQTLYVDADTSISAVPYNSVDITKFGRQAIQE